MSDHGKVLGAEFARIADEQATSHPEIPERCKSCAFRDGTIPNGHAGTLVDAMHCVLGTDPSPFWCHSNMKADGTPTEICAGYRLARAAPFKSVKAAIGRAAVKLTDFPQDHTEETRP